jgi:hypothetical protein
MPYAFNKYRIVPVPIKQISDRPFKSYDFYHHRSLDVKIFLLIARDQR